MTIKEMRDYLIDIIRTDGISDGNHHYFTEEEVKQMTPNQVANLYNLCHLNFGDKPSYSRVSDIWEF